MDVDVQLAMEKWERGEWSCFDVAESISRQWRDRSVRDEENERAVNARSADDIAAFLKASAACAMQLAAWTAQIAAVMPK